MPILSVEDVWKTYPDGTTAVRGVTFKADRGIVMLMGPNGSGKTTTLEMVAGALRPSKGRIVVCGHDMWSGPRLPPRRCVGYSPQEPPRVRNLTALEYLVWIGLLRGMGFREAGRRARRLLGTVGLEAYASKRPSQLSGGMRKRLIIASALMGDPRILVLDEPTSGLDPAARRELWSLVRRLSGDRLVIASTHIAVDAEEYADKVLIFYKGRIVAEGPPERLIKRYAPPASILVRLEEPLKSPPSILGGARLSQKEGEVLRYSSEDPDRDLPSVVEGLARLGARIRSVTLSRPGLAEVYLRLTGSSLAG